MNEVISVLIADDNIEFGDLLTEYIAQIDDIRVVGLAKDGVQTLEMIKKYVPDVVILDIIMPNLDGIGVLERMPAIQLRHKPLFIMLSAIGQDVFIQRAISLGAEYYIVKPFDVEILISRIRQIYREKYKPPFSFNRKASTNTISDSGWTKQEDSMEVRVTNLMHDAGIPPHVPGYQYIREAVLYTISNSKNGSPAARLLYPAVAKKFNTTPQKVERAIRGAIESGWTKAKTGSERTSFYIKNIRKCGKPSNFEFIAFMCDKVRLGAVES